MKKFTACFLLISLALSCSKEALICGCSPVNDSFTFVVKNQLNQDLLNPAVAGAYTKSAIRVTYRTGGVVKTAGFNIADPFPASSTINFPYHSVNASLSMLSANQNFNEAFIDFGNGDTDTLTFTYDKISNTYSQVKLNNKVLPVEPLSPAPGKPVYVVLK